MLNRIEHFDTVDSFRKDYGYDSDIPVHLHSSFEIITVSGGIAKVRVSKRAYDIEKGQAVLVFPNQPHSIDGKNCSYIMCSFSPEMVGAFSSTVVGIAPVSSLFSPDPYLLSALEMLSQRSSLAVKKGVFYSLCSEFDSSAEYQKRFEDDEEFIFQALRWVEDNYLTKCDLAGLSTVTGYCSAHISRIFKKLTGTSIVAFVNRRRIKHACYLLESTVLPVSECAAKSGFGSVRNFDRNFIYVTGLTPKEYRELIKKRQRGF